MSSEGGAYAAPFAAVSSTDHGGALLNANIIGLVISLASVGVRFYISNRVSESGYTIYKDDVLCFTGLAICIIEFALVYAGISNGNGKAIDLISPSNLVHLQQIQYATDIFYIFSLLCSRASIILLYQRIQGIGPIWLWNTALVVLSLWAIACVFSAALKCDLNQPWIQYNVSCTGLLARWQAIQISSIVIECAIFALGVYLITTVRMKLSSKAQVLVLFGTRVLVVISSALCVAYLPDYFHSSSPTYSGIPASIYALASMYGSLITATTPLLKPFIVKFGLISAKPTIIQVPLSCSSGNTEQSEPEENGKTRGSRRHKKKKHYVEPDSENGDTHSSRSTDSTFSGYQQWIGRNNHWYADTTTTASSEDYGSDRTLQAA